MASNLRHFNFPVKIFFIFIFVCVGSSFLLRRLFPIWGKWGLLFVLMHQLLIAVASLTAEHGLWARRLQ